MKVCFTSDIHGREPLYEQLELLLARERPELLILGGDMQPDGSPDDPARSQASWIRGSCLPRLRRWLATWPKLRIASVLGNHDWRFAGAVLDAACDGQRLILLDLNRVYDLGGVRFVGFPYTPPTPWHVKDYERLDMPGDPLPVEGGLVGCGTDGSFEMLDNRACFERRPPLSAELNGWRGPGAPWFFVAHAPPYDTRLDRLPGIDHPVGSRAIRTFIEAHAPACGLHGHIHESPQVTGDYMDRIGATLCVNPGQNQDTLHAVLFELSDPGGTMRHTVYG